jgi:putative alpha-1,2-mannosidase
LNITENNVSDKGLYIQSMTINGQAWDKSWFSHTEIENGGEIIFEMGLEPTKRLCAESA